MKVLVAGVTGYLGGRIAHALARAGHEVRGFARDPARWRDRPAGAEAIQGDVTELSAYGRAAQGCDAVIHAAGLVRSWTRDSRAFDRVNVEGVGNAVEAARSARARLVYTSSFLALGATDESVGDERSTRADEPFRNHYELGYEITPLATGLSATLAWLRESGMLDPASTRA